MKKYRIPITYECIDTFDVEAENLQEALNKALNEFLSIPDNKYLMDSFEFDDIILEEYPDEECDFNKVHINT